MPASTTFWLQTRLSVVIVSRCHQTHQSSPEPLPLQMHGKTKLCKQLIYPISLYIGLSLSLRGEWTMNTTQLVLKMNKSYKTNTSPFHLACSIQNIIYVIKLIFSKKLWCNVPENFVSCVYFTFYKYFEKDDRFLETSNFFLHYSVCFSSSLTVLDVQVDPLKLCASPMVTALRILLLFSY